MTVRSFEAALQLSFMRLTKIVLNNSYDFHYRDHLITYGRPKPRRDSWHNSRQGTQNRPKGPQFNEVFDDYSFQCACGIWFSWFSYQQSVKRNPEENEK